MRSWIRFFIPAFVVVVGLVFFACSSSNNDNGNSGDNGTNEPTATEAADNGQPTADTSNDGGATDDLMQLAQEFGGAEVKVDYNISTTGTDQDFSGSMTIYQKPPDSWRMDLSVPDQGNVTFISSGGTSYMCADQGGEGACFSSAIDQSIGGPFLTLFNDPADFENEINSAFGGANVDKSSRQIAGQDATCFSASDDQGQAEYCFRDDGVLLLAHASGSTFGADGEFSLEATNVGSVSDSDFEPIYDVMDLGGALP